MAIEKNLLDRLLVDYRRPDDLIGEGGPEPIFNHIRRPVTGLLKT